MHLAKSISSARGFTLVEIAMVLLIVSLLLGGLLMPLATQVDTQRVSDTQKTLSEINEALIGYALRNFATLTTRPFLPCPDTDNDGIENRGGAPTFTCTAAEGRVPWVTLGVAATDPWGNHYRYRVHPNFSNGQNGFTLTTATAPTMAVCSIAGGCALTSAVAQPVIAVVLSHGKNGYGAYNQGGGTNPAPPAINTDEVENRNSDVNFVSRTMTSVRPPPCSGVGQPACEFDDIVSWISPNLLMSRLVAGNRAQ